MREFLAGDALTNAIDEILAEDECRCAVAFWGKDLDRKLPKSGKGRFRIICNLASGATNPAFLRKIDRKKARQCDRLHAKVYLGTNSAIITSANASTNGLGLEGIEQASWIEAGVRVFDLPAITSWFERLWEESREITDNDLRRAQMLWDTRQQVKPCTGFAEFDVTGPRLPHLYSIRYIDYEVNSKCAKEQFGDVVEGTRLIDDSLDAMSDADARVMKPGTWIILWEMGANGRPKRRPAPTWFYTGRKISQSFRYRGEKKWRDSILRADISPPPPFDFKAPYIREAFLEILSQDKFARLRDEESGPEWFTQSRLNLERKFWIAFKARFLELKDAGV